MITAKDIFREFTGSDLSNHPLVEQAMKQYAIEYHEHELAKAEEEAFQRKIDKANKKSMTRECINCGKVHNEISPVCSMECSIEQYGQFEALYVQEQTQNHV